MPESDKTRERTPANLGIKYNPNLGANGATTMVGPGEAGAAGLGERARGK